MNILNNIININNTLILDNAEIFGFAYPIVFNENKIKSSYNDYMLQNINKIMVKYPYFINIYEKVKQERNKLNLKDKSYILNIDKIIAINKIEDLYYIYCTVKFKNEENNIIRDKSYNTIRTVIEQFQEQMIIEKNIKNIYRNKLYI